MSKFTSESVKSTAGTVAAALAIPVLIGGSLTGMIAGATAGGDEQNQSQPAVSAHLNSAPAEDAPKQEEQPKPAENEQAEPAPAENHAVEAAPVAEQAPPAPPALPEIPGYGPHETQNAATIVAVGKQLNVSEHGQVVAVATAMQESGLRNLDWGDRDSLGLFQQRPSMGWGTPEQVTDPAYSATKFYEGLMQVPGWENMALTDAAQVVQKSGFPYAYAKHEPTARVIVDAVKGLS
ncbi:hypothetical protein ABZ639_20305 [Saccharomonospora sp. NPDC006951]